MAQSTSEKLGIKPGSTALVVGQLPSDAIDLLRPFPADARVVGQAVSADVVILFAEDVSTVSDLARSALDLTKPAGRLWIAYRKGASRRATAGEPAPLHRDTLQVALAGVGLDGVTLIAIDDTWSAMRIKAIA
jgi:hypothetical protein